MISTCRLYQTGGVPLETSYTCKRTNVRNFTLMTCTDQVADRQQMGVCPRKLHSRAPQHASEAVRGSWSDFQRVGDGFDQFGQKAVKNALPSLHVYLHGNLPRRQKCGNPQKFHLAKVRFSTSIRVSEIKAGCKTPCFKIKPYPKISENVSNPNAKKSKTFPTDRGPEKCKLFFSTEKCKLFFSGKCKSFFISENANDFLFRNRLPKNASDFYFWAISKKCKRFFLQKKKSH